MFFSPLLDPFFFQVFVFPFPFPAHPSPSRATGEAAKRSAAAAARGPKVIRWSARACAGSGLAARAQATRAASSRPR
jgi:hypothetical protein